MAEPVGKLGQESFETIAFNLDEESLSFDFSSTKLHSIRKWRYRSWFLSSQKKEPIDLSRKEMN